MFSMTALLGTLLPFLCLGGKAAFSSATDELGYRGLGNLLAGVATVSATLGANAPGARPVGKVSLDVRAGYASLSNVNPSSLSP
jgi:hypothetical protein